MYYTSREIYHCVQRGVEFEVLAELNGCNVSEIKRAYREYETKIIAKDKEYQKLLTAHREKSVPLCTEDIIYTKEEIKMDKKRRFKYTDELEKAISHCLAEGKSAPVAYGEIFENAETKPTLESFRVKYRRLKNNSTESVKLKAEKKTPKKKENLNSLYHEIEKKIDDITEEYKSAIRSLIELQIKIEKELDK